MYLIVGFLAIVAAFFVISNPPSAPNQVLQTTNSYDMVFDQKQAGSELQMSSIKIIPKVTPKPILGTPIN